ncbi:MAG: peptide deformylase [Firmicutes bacterium]|nr:peptide deformylase [Bacillota bacterium]
MALRRIRKEGEEILRKKSREVDVITDKIINLLNDMAETMYENDGIGLAAPQVGVLKRAIVIDIEDGKGLFKLINPRIVSEEGEQSEAEGCLSIPGVYGEVKRPQKVVVEALNEKGEEVVITGEGLLARVLCHEIDHLDGILFKDKVIRYIDSR